MDPKNDLLSGFHKLTREERLKRIQSFSGLTDDEAAIFRGDNPVSPAIAENFIENVIGYFPIPFGVATNFKIDGKDLLIPMAVEETSIIAAASATAKWIRKEGTIETYSKGRLILGQIQIPNVQNVEKVKQVLTDKREAFIQLANTYVPGLVQRGGGIQDLSAREVKRPDGTGSMLVIHVHCDPCDAMGANIINQVCEGLKPAIEKFTGEKVGLCILSNLVDGRLAGAHVLIRNIDPKLGKGIEEATLFAKADPYRAATHNKGVLNGIDPILIATGNDWRAVEAGIHAYASRTGRYSPVTHWQMKGNDLMGTIEVPLSVGTVGGVTRSHPFSKIVLKMLQVEHADELARICVAVGLVQNLGALRALSTVGIVRGHMQLHAANLAIAAGAEVHEIADVRERLAEILKVEKHISVTKAKEVLSAVRASVTSPSLTRASSVYAASVENSRNL